MGSKNKALQDVMARARKTPIPAGGVPIVGQQPKRPAMNPNQPQLQDPTLDHYYQYQVDFTKAKFINAVKLAFCNLFHPVILFFMISLSFIFGRSLKFVKIRIVKQPGMPQAPNIPGLPNIPTAKVTKAEVTPKGEEVDLTKGEIDPGSQDDDGDCTDANLRDEKGNLKEDSSNESTSK